MKLIERYIFMKACMASLLVLGSLLGVVWVVQALRQVDVITANSQSILTYLAITTLAVPGLVLAIIPIALLLATIHTINAMNSNSELVVVSASGFSNWTIARPLIVLAFLCSVVVGVVGHFLTPISLAKLRSEITEMRADLVSVIIREGTFNTIEEGLTFHIGRRGAGGILYGILISDDRPESDNSIFYTAKEGIVTRTRAGAFLLLKDGEIHQKDRSDGTVTVVKYQSYLFDMSSFSGVTKSSPRRAKERMTHELLNPDPDDAVYKKDPGGFRSQIHERFAEMIWPFAYVFLILAFAGQARSSRQSFSASISAAAISVVVARGMGFSSITALKSNPDGVMWVYFLPTFCAIVGAGFVITNRSATLPKPVSDQLDRATLLASARFEEIQNRYRRYLRRRAGVGT